MTCVCCPNSCCPAFRAFDGSDVFYRWKVQVDFDIPYNAPARYFVNADDPDSSAYIDAANTLATVPRPTDGIFVADASRVCPGFALPATEDDLPSKWLEWATAAPNRISSGEFDPYHGRFSSQQAPWRQPDVYNFGGGRNLGGPLVAFGRTEYHDIYTDAIGDFDWVNSMLAGNLARPQKYGKSLLRVQLFGRFASRPSAACVLNNPLP